MIRFTVEVSRAGDVTISDYIGNSGLYYCREGIQANNTDRERENQVWNACDEIADAAREIDRLIGSDVE